MPTSPIPLTFGERMISKVLLVVFLLAVAWLVLAVDMVTGAGLNGYGLRPRTLMGLSGILTMPFLHAGWGHLAANTGGFLVFGGLVLVRSSIAEFLAKSILIMILGGGLVWLAGRDAMHIGASGLIFGYFGWTVARGWYERKTMSILIAVSMLFLFGGMLWTALPTATAMSWESHLFGFLAGVFGAKWVFESATSLAP